MLRSNIKSNSFPWKEIVLYLFSISSICKSHPHLMLIIIILIMSFSNAVSYVEPGHADDSPHARVSQPSPIRIILPRPRHRNTLTPPPLIIPRPAVPIPIIPLKLVHSPHILPPANTPHTNTLLPRSGPPRRPRLGNIARRRRIVSHGLVLPLMPIWIVVIPIAPIIPKTPPVVGSSIVVVVSAAVPIPIPVSVISSLAPTAPRRAGPRLPLPLPPSLLPPFLLLVLLLRALERLVDSKGDRRADEAEGNGLAPVEAGDFLFKLFAFFALFGFRFPGSWIGWQ